MARRYRGIQVKFPYVMHDVDRHGNDRWYYRRAGRPKVRLPSPKSREFMKAYLAAENNNKTKEVTIPANGTVANTIPGYYKHNSFTTLAPASQNLYRGIIERFNSKFGALPIADMQPDDFARIVGALKPFAAHNWKKAIRSLMQYAIAMGLRKHDPTAGVKMPSVATDGFHSWTDEEITKFEDHFPIGSKPRLAMALLLYTAARRSDAVRFGPQNIRDGFLTYTQQKTRRQLTIPVHQSLSEVLAASPIGIKTFLVTRAGKPYEPESFSNNFRSWCREAGLSECSAHGLRKAQARRLAEAGCTAPQIAAITGHKTLEDLQIYIKAANQALLAQAAMEAVKRRF